MKYLVYDPEFSAIMVKDQKPPQYTGTTNPRLGEGLIPVWHPPQTAIQTLLHAIHVLLTRSVTQPSMIPFSEINSTVDQIVSQYHPDHYAFVGLGASPKIIRWILKGKGYETKVINVSNVQVGADSTPQFKGYVERKLRSITHYNIALIDYAENGGSLVALKKYLSGPWREMGKGAIVAVALGLDNYHSPYYKDIDFIPKGIPKFVDGLRKSRFKEMLGRNKEGRDYATFPEPDQRKGTGRGPVSDQERETYQMYKSGFARAAELGLLEMDLNDFREIQETVRSDSDDVGEDFEALASSVYVPGSDDEYGW